MMTSSARGIPKPCWSFCRPFLLGTRSHGSNCLMRRYGGHEPGNAARALLVAEQASCHGASGLMLGLYTIHCLHSLSFRSPPQELSQPRLSVDKSM